MRNQGQFSRPSLRVTTAAEPRGRKPVKTQVEVGEEPKKDLGLMAKLAAVAAAMVGTLTAAAITVSNVVSPAPPPAMPVVDIPSAQVMQSTTQLDSLAFTKASEDTIGMTNPVLKADTGAAQLTDPQAQIHEPAVVNEQVPVQNPPEEPPPEPAPPQQEIVRMFYPISYVRPAESYWNIDTSLYCYAHHFRQNAANLLNPAEMVDPVYYNFATGQFEPLTFEVTREQNRVFRDNNFNAQPFYPQGYMVALDLVMDEVGARVDISQVEREANYYRLVRLRMLNYAWYTRQGAQTRLRPQFTEGLPLTFVDGLANPDQATQYFFERYPTRLPEAFAGDIKGLIESGDVAILAYPSFSGSLVLQITLPSFLGIEASIEKGNLESAIMGGRYQDWPRPGVYYANTQTITNPPKNILVDGKVQASVLPIGFARVDNVLLKLTLTDSRDGKVATYEIHFLII